MANYANRKNSYVSYIAPIISYGSSVCGNQAKLNSVKLKVYGKKQQIGSLEAKFLTKNNSQNSIYFPYPCTVSYMSFCYLQKILTGKVNLNWKLYVSITEPGTTRYQTTRNFICRQPKLRKCESDYWYRPCHLANTFNEFFQYNILFHENHKAKLQTALR